MSNLAYAQPSTRPSAYPAARPAPRRVEIVPSRQQRRARPKAIYAAVTVASLFVIFAAQLLLSIVVGQGAYQIQGLQDQHKQLLRTQEALTENLDLYGSTQNLAANAAKLGMVPSSSPMLLNLETGAVSGAPGSVDRNGCGGTCNLVANSLLTGVPLIDPSKPAAAAVASTAAVTPTPSATVPPTTRAPEVVTALPAPVTH